MKRIPSVDTYASAAMNVWLSNFSIRGAVMKPITDKDVQAWLMRKDTEIAKTWVDPTPWDAQSNKTLIGASGKTKFSAIRNAIQAERDSKL